MRWRQNARFIFTLILALQDIPLGKGYRKEMERGHTGENDDARAPKHHTKDQATTLNVFREMNQSYESKKHMNFRPVVPFTGLTQSRTLNRHCCQNGGTCILGSFCACPKHFIGRYCEYDERKSSCGPFKHGEWIQKACRLCRCGFGVFHCLSQPIQNCVFKLPKTLNEYAMEAGKNIQEASGLHTTLLPLPMEGRKRNLSICLPIVQDYNKQCAFVCSC